MPWVGRCGAMPGRASGLASVANRSAAARLLEDQTFKFGPASINLPYRLHRRRINIVYRIRQLIAATVITPSLCEPPSHPLEFLSTTEPQSRASMVCLYHGDYGPPDPAFNLGSASAWAVDANSLKEARNLGEAEAIQRHLLRGEAVSWCHQGYAWADQDAVVWFYSAAFLFVILPYLIMRAKAWAKGVSRPNTRAERLTRRLRFPR